MKSQDQGAPGYFEIARERADISFERFRERYYDAERPVVIEGVGADWPGRRTWTADYLQRALSKEPTASASTLWYWLDHGALAGDYAVPDIIDRLYRSGRSFPRSQNLRIWVHPAGNVSPWHYDTNLVNVFNIQVTGKKEWVLLSPETPPRCYPFSFYAIIDGQGDEILRGRKYTRATLNEGDMIYIPPCWFHNVLSCGTENISLNWILTNRRTSVESAAMRRDLEIYTLQHYFMTHRSETVRQIFDKAYFAIPGFLRFRWRYDELIEVPHPPGRSDLWKRVLKELAALGPALVNADKAYAAIRGIRAVRKLEPE